MAIIEVDFKTRSDQETEQTLEMEANSTLLTKI